MAVLQASLRGSGDAKTPLRAAVYASVSNIVLDPIAIFTLGLGLQGAAIATVASQVCILRIRHGPKRYLNHPDIVLDITQLLGTCRQKRIFLCVMHP
jgi:peptidoglycan biosynthesis protein MviN/MurJ (putative lipid II flippase)